MSDTRYLDWPFFESRHVEMQRELDAWAREHISQDAHADVDGECRALVAALGDGGWLAHAVAGTPTGARARCWTRARCA
jgi:acyl-CoA dehydrogenase